MKQFTTIKTGYTHGIYGCSNEYFTTIYINSKGINSLHFHGMYGAEERIAKAFEEKGYKKIYTQSFYGKMTRKDVTKNSISEYQALNLIKRYLKLSK